LSSSLCLDHKLTETHLILKTSTELKETLIEGIATLYAVDENNDKDAKKLAKSLKQLPTVRKDFDSLRWVPDLLLTSFFTMLVHS
jgi:hypothetical protein